MAYQTAFAQGRSVLETDAGGPADQEVRVLMGQVWRRLKGERTAAPASANDDLRRGRLSLSPIA